MRKPTENYAQLHKLLLDLIELEEEEPQLEEEKTGCKNNTNKCSSNPLGVKINS